MNEWIKKLTNQIVDEMDGAKDYIKCALNYKEKDRTVSEIYYNMAQQEMSHCANLNRVMETLHDESNLPEEALIDFMKSMENDKIAELRILMSMYKE